jgi:hypothetical protein
MPEFVYSAIVSIALLLAVGTAIALAMRRIDALPGVAVIGGANAAITMVNLAQGSPLSAAFNAVIAILCGFYVATRVAGQR